MYYIYRYSAYAQSHTTFEKHMLVKITILCLYPSNKS